MTETTARIRWRTDDDGETTGYVGSLDRPVFRIWPPDDDGDCLLFVYLAGHAGDLYHGATIDGQHAQAERLLGEFVSSFGAVFPEGAALPPCGPGGKRDLTCGACGGVFGTNFHDEEIECAHCGARRCPHCGEWFGRDD